MRRSQRDRLYVPVRRAAVIDGDHKDDEMPVIDGQDNPVSADPAGIERDFFVTLKFFYEQPRLSLLREIV